LGDPNVEFENDFVGDVCKFGAFERIPEMFDGIESSGA
jgi:hypothetical protein